MPVAKAVQVLKANSSSWLHEHGVDFAWQEGYGAFSVSSSNRDAVINYIENQAEHHQKRSFESEFETLLRKSGIAFDPKDAFGWVPSLRDSLQFLTSTRHCRAGLTHSVPSALGPRCQLRLYPTLGLIISNLCAVRVYCAPPMRPMRSSEFRSRFPSLR
jgi:hypothetical protein